MEAYRHKNLVYIPFPKHASRSYIHLFANVLGWERTESYHVDWDDDVIFGHLIHPLTRHINGVVQALKQNDLLHLIKLEDFKKLLQTSVFFDQHSYPLTRMLDLEQCYKIEWLLLDHDCVSSEELTQCFLKSHGIEISINDIPKLNQTQQELKFAKDEILKQKQKQESMNSLIFALQEDLNLYNKVLTHTSFDQIKTMPWNKISYKKNIVEKYGMDYLKKVRFNLDI
jgi:hypothetical protein